MRPLQGVLRGLLAAALFAGFYAASEARAGAVLDQVIKGGTLRVAIIGGNPPHSKMSPSGEPEGYDIDIAKAIADALKVKVEFITTDIPGRVTSLQTGKADLTIADFTKTVQRSTSIAFTDPYLVVSLQFLVAADRKELNGVADLDKAEVKVGI